ncbi:MAG TPA: TIGR03560 family F420-dependent LLM class oxidoreductase [Solirubrobacteraceae bacterium]|nr:TIGR03560 family F420-dependent LLM class oxidoreductase [Solirubrobacteraceae bacterium]
MQLCLMIEGQEDVTWEQWVALARACEDHGIGTLFRSDHYMNLDGEAPERGSLDAWGTLCALGAATHTLRLGTLVSPVTFRHPSALARIVVTADHVSGGRVELGLGAGWHEREHAAHGFPFPPLKVRMDMLEEQLEIVTGTWSGGSFSLRGEHYAVEELAARPRPVQTSGRAGIPLLMGGDAGPRGARLAAAYADEYNTAFATLEEIRERRERIADACATAGREMLRFSVMTGVVVAEDGAALAARCARLEARAHLPQGSLLGDAPEGWIVGTVEDVGEQLGALRDAGVDRVMCQHLLHDELEPVALLGERVAPLVA